MKKQPDPIPPSPDFQEVVNLLAVFSQAANVLRQIEADANGELLELIDELKADYAAAQEAATRAESALETVCRAHPEWFQSARSIKTPYGKVSFHKGTRIEFDNAEATCRLLRHVLEPDEADDYIRRVEEPDKEAMAALTDEVLKAVMARRVPEDSFSVTAAKVDFGKAVKEAAEKEA